MSGRSIDRQSITVVYIPMTAIIKQRARNCHAFRLKLRVAFKMIDIRISHISYKGLISMFPIISVTLCHLQHLCKQIAAEIAGPMLPVNHSPKILRSLQEHFQNHTGISVGIEKSVLFARGKGIRQAADIQCPGSGRQSILAYFIASGIYGHVNPIYFITLSPAAEGCRKIIAFLDAHGCQTAS